MDNRHILVVEDEDIAREYVAQSLRDNGFFVDEAAGGAEALQALRERDYAVVISDIRMPDMNGMELLEQIKNLRPDTEVILATGYASVEDAVRAVKMGAYQYLAKPLRLEEVTLMAERAVEKRRIHVELQSLRRQLHNANMPKIVGHSRVMQDLRQQIRRVGAADCTVLLLGETGTGKELVARSLHAQSRRAAGRFLAVNCAALSDELLAHELFGHEKAAFTGAYSAQKGLLEAAGQGTFFLDEVGDMSLTMQASMLRVLESRTLFRVGGTREIPVDVRILAATNKDLPRMIEEGSFRRDLYYRLNIMTLRIPPLAGRREDIPLLAYYFLTRAEEGKDKKIRNIDPEAMALLQRHDYPGNVRELQHIMERAAILCNSDSIGPAHLPPELRTDDCPDGKGTAPAPWPHEEPPAGAGQELRHLVPAATAAAAAPQAENARAAGQRFVSLEENERRYLAEVMRAAGGSTSGAAKLLGLNRGTLWRKLKRLGLAD
ncbi:sigma-54 dependent transcriptional regulator [Desulfovibrio sp. OttesenSCG-928-A18]|nr:sigma-54 dependent transcriptional regulator [Desulfovibrio sp. OttesenSCG-928-A18]